MTQSLVVYGPVLEVYQFTVDFGGGVILAPCLQQFAAEVRLACLMGLLSVTNLGELGNAAHQANGTGSDHNPWVQMLLSWLVRALDFGGQDWPLLLEFWNWKYGQRDPRVYFFGYTNSNLRGQFTGLTIWGGDGSTRPGTDGPHAHLSVTCADGYAKRRGPGNFTAALADRSEWGLIPWLMWKRGHAPTPFGTTNPTSPIHVEDVTHWEEDLVDILLEPKGQPGSERPVIIPPRANDLQAVSYGAPGSLQIQAFTTGGVGGFLGGDGYDKHAAPLVPNRPLHFDAKTFDGKRYRSLYLRNNGATRVAVQLMEV